MIDADLPRSDILVPPAEPAARGLRKLRWYLVGGLLTPFYWLLAHRPPAAPGLAFHRRCAGLGLRLLVARRAPLQWGWSYRLTCMPMDSTRYFELDFAWRALADAPLSRYLDVSSPRLLPLLLAASRPTLTATLVNPDPHDLALTDQLRQAMGLAQRCHLQASTIAAAALPAASFDAITSLSVIEHIPEDRRAVAAMWALLKPGGRLALSVPCAARPSVQYINQDEYGVLAPDRSGFVFWQRFYDRTLLEERVFSVTGAPVHSAVYGEKVPGAIQRNADAKRRTSFSAYPFWREPFMMAQEYAHFPNVAALPGEGVIALEFRKP
jgi:SAM-dependent methyltransferase